MLVAAILCLTWLFIALSIQPIKMFFGMPGMLVYALGLMAVAMFALQQSLAAYHSSETRAWYGIASGFLAWVVVSITTHMGLQVFNPAGAVLLMMVSLIVVLLWRTVLPVGARFFALTFLLNWSGGVLMIAEETLSGFSPVFTLAYRATGVLSILFAILVLGWILFQTNQRMQRIVGALAFWFLYSLALYVFQGNLF